MSLIERRWLCDLCGQPLAGSESRCNSGLHQGPDDPNGWRGKAVEYVPADQPGAVEALRIVSEEAIRDPQPHSSAWLIPAGAMDLVRHHLRGQ